MKKEKIGKFLMDLGGAATLLGGLKAVGEGEEMAEAKARGEEPKMGPGLLAVFVGAALIFIGIMLGGEEVEKEKQ
jgi:hypothetical protein